MPSPYATHALELSDSVHSDHWHIECIMLKAKYYFERGDLQKGKNAILQIIAFYHRTGVDSAENKFQTVMETFRSLKKRPTPMTLFFLAELYLDKDDIAQVITYALEGLDVLKPSDQHFLFSFHNLLSESFSRLGQIDNALAHARIAMDIAVRNNYPDIFYVSKMIVDDLLKKDSARSAASFIRQSTLAHPPASPLQERAIDYCNAVIYDQSGQFTTAETYFLRMISGQSASRKELTHQIFMDLYITQLDVSVSIAKFYMH